MTKQNMYLSLRTAFLVMAGCALILYVLYRGISPSWSMYYPFLMAGLGFLMMTLVQRSPFQNVQSIIVPALAALAALAAGFALREEMSYVHGIFSGLTIGVVFLTIYTTPGVKLTFPYYWDMLFGSLVIALLALWGTGDFTVMASVFMMIAAYLYRRFAMKLAQASAK